MKIIYYKSLICPRCIPTNRLIGRLKREHPEIEIEEVEMLTNFSRAIADGIHMLPTLVIGAQRFTSAPPMQAIEALLAAESNNLVPNAPSQPAGAPMQ